MSLTKQDLADIRTVFLEAYEAIIAPRFEDIEKQLDGLKAGQASLEAGQAKTNHRLDDLAADNAAAVRELKDMHGRLETLENDIHELYKMTPAKPSTDFASKAYQNLSDKKKLFVLNQELHTLAKHFGVALPRQ
jgi:chromosome segregation ATPase